MIALAFLLLAVSAPALAQTPTPIESINQYVTGEMKPRQIPGLSVAVLRGDRVLLARGYGLPIWSFAFPPVTAQGIDSSVLAPGLRRFLTGADRKDLKQTLDQLKFWTMLGCDDVAGSGITWLGGNVERICYARGSGSAQPVAASVFYTKD